MTDSFFREIEKEVSGPILRNPNMRLEWGCVQNNDYDKDTKPFGVYRFSDLKQKVECLDGNFMKMYCICRWFRYWCARCDEYCFCFNGKAVLNPNVFDRGWDFEFKGINNVEDIKFDLKSTRMPNEFSDEEKDFYRNNPENLIVWYYQKQSKGVRNGYQNRLFLVHLAEDARTENIKRVSFDKKRNLIGKYYESIESGKHQPYTIVVDNHKVTSDILFV